MVFHSYVMVAKWIRKEDYLKNKNRSVRILIYLFLTVFIFFSQFIFINREVLTWLGGKFYTFHFFIKKIKKIK